ncbi:replicative DNA helicase [Oribacterium sp. oral taxon 078 str. F0263]|uniref:replicative DNA helicase n=1 Tax=Oribacterium sp. oral taxon 078 TaxID=652706 RepID=UPI0001BCB8BF|nr:replicative DNA helicase [Oribacterium sp. oral taxon 078]EFE90575.1 replicative DNA helicase [Oribacterium sp. oral taxon 078 str. F0262]ERL22224.1 replicative DNA helicase [Oribacterium sp. oral taxon 078 str. F0263]
MAELSEKLIQRVIPHSQEAEQSVIGSMLRDKEAVAAATELLSEEDFYQRQYAILFRVMRELYNEAKPVDLVTVQEKLRGKDIPPELSEIAFLKEVMQSVATSVNVRSYCSIVKEKSVLRALIRANEEIAELCYSGGEELEEVLSIAEKKIFDLLQKRSAREFTPIEDVAMTVLHNIEKASRQKDPITGVPTGFLDLDYRTAGLQPSDLILVAARPSMGKTAFVLNILDYVGVRKNMPAMVFSLEMSKEQLVNRMLSLETLIDADKLRKGTLTDEDWATLIEGIDRVVASNIIIDDTPGISVSELRSKCRKAKLERGLSLIMIDYLQLMTGSAGKRAENRQQEITEISRSLKALAREMNCPVIALSQLSRACEQRPDHRPMLSDLRDSGAIEQDADIVMFLYRDDYYNKDTEHPNEAEIIIAKQRNGPIGTVTLLWQPEYTRFVNAERGS